MSKARVHISVSADGYVAGPNQSRENPLGERGEGLHDWVVALRAWRELHGREGGEVNASTAVLEEAQASAGAEIMGRGKFGGGIEAALERARAAAAGQDVTIGGGADVINQYLAAGLVDELELHVVPLLLGGGARLFEGVGPDVTLEQVRAVGAPGVTHLKYRLSTLSASG